MHDRTHRGDRKSDKSRPGTPRAQSIGGRKGVEGAGSNPSKMGAGSIVSARKDAPAPLADPILNPPPRTPAQQKAIDLRTRKLMCWMRRAQLWPPRHDTRYYREVAIRGPESLARVLLRLIANRLDAAPSAVG